MSDRSASASADSQREFELVLGNRQLFSLLFIVFVLLGVFFAMGYMMGRSSTLPTVASSPSTEIPIDPAARSAARPSATFGSTEAPAAEGASPAPIPATAAATTERKEDPSATIITEPTPGQTFLQVSAVARSEAELLVDVLNRKNFRTILAAGPSEKLFRVLVGPARSDADLARIKAELERAGFKPIIRRY